MYVCCCICLRYGCQGQRDTRGFYQNHPHITSLTERLYDKRVTGESIWLIELYAAWCGACQRFVPTYKSIAEELRNDDVEVGAINCEVETHLCSRIFNIRAYPTLRLVSKKHGVQQEYDDHNRDVATVAKWVREVAKEWKWLFARSNLTHITSPQHFNQRVIDSPDFWVLLLLDGLECGPCKTAKTNMMRLSAGLLGLSGVSTGYFDCSVNNTHRTFCATLELPSSPHSPQVRAWRRGKKYLGDIGELLYNPNHVEPHFALQLIEAAVRLSSETTAENAVADTTKPKFDKESGEEQTEEPPHEPPPERMWNGPKGRAPLNAISHGGGQVRLQLSQ